MAYIVMAYKVMAYTGVAYAGIAYTVVAYTVMAYIVVAGIVMAYIAMAYIVMAYIAMAYIVMAYIVMAYIVMAYIPDTSYAHRLGQARARLSRRQLLRESWSFHSPIACSRSCCTRRFAWSRRSRSFSRKSYFWRRTRKSTSGFSARSIGT